MKHLFPILLLSAFVSQSLPAQEGEKPREKIFYLGPALKIIPHHETSTGVLVGLSAAKALRNNPYTLSLTLLRNINTMESDLREGYEFQSFYYTTVGVSRTLISILENLSVDARADIGFGFVREYDGILSDARSIGWNGFFSLEPGIGIAMKPVERLKISASTSYIFNTRSVEEVDFQKPLMDFSLQFNF